MRHLRSVSRHAVNWDHPANRGLVMWLYGLPGRCGGGQWRDLTGRHTGTLVGGPTWVPTGRGDLGVELVPASSQYIDCASVDGQIVGASQVSVSVWVNRTPGTVAMAFRGTNTSTGFGIQWFLDNQIYCVADTGSGQAYASVGSGASGWHLVHIAFDGTLSGSDRMRLWLDGERRSLSFVGTMPTAVAAGGAGWAIGWSASVGIYQTGAVADHSVWTGRAWSDADAWSLYAESRRGYPDRLRRVEDD